jgi:hypothetical protein
VHRGSEPAKVLLRQSLAAMQRGPPMPTECSPGLFDFAPVEGRAVVAGFDGGAITSDAGALLLGATDRAIGLVGRFAVNRPGNGTLDRRRIGTPFLVC